MTNPTKAKRESRHDREVREARDSFCAVRRDPDMEIRWIAWLHLRSLVEGWDRYGEGRFAANIYLVEASAWKRGFRPPTTYHEAMARARADRRAGRLRHPDGH